MMNWKIIKRKIFRVLLVFLALMFLMLIGFIVYNLNFNSEIQPNNPFLINSVEKVGEVGNEDSSSSKHRSNRSPLPLLPLLPLPPLPPLPPLVVAHRGGANLAPENTMEVFEISDRLGVDLLEMDTRLSKDMELVVIHDSKLDRTSDGMGFISNFSLEELKDFNFGYHFTKAAFNNDSVKYPYREPERSVKITKLEDVMRKFSHRKMMIEIKDSEERGYEAARMLLGYLKKYEMLEKVVVGSFHDDVLIYLRSLSVKVIIGAGPIEGMKFLLAHFTGLPLFEFYSQVLIFPTRIKWFDLANREVLETAHQRNLAVHYWTINDEPTMRKLSALGVDGIITDHPDILLKLSK